MLSTEQSTTLSGTSKVTFGGTEVVAVSLNATISESGNSNIIFSIVNQEAYDANKADCRADIDAFTEEVRTIEDLNNVEE